MDITVTSTGKTFYQIDNAVAALLMEAFPASFERANPRPQPKPEAPTPQWGVGTHQVSGQLFVKLTVGEQTTFYFGPPKGLATYRFGWPVPESIAKEYERRWQAPTVSDMPKEYYDAMRGK